MIVIRGEKILFSLRVEWGLPLSPLKETAMKKIIAIAFITLTLSLMLAAGQLSLSFYQNSTNNLFQTCQAEKDEISLLNLSWDKSIGSFSLFAEGAYSYLRRNSSLGNGALSAGADYLVALNQKTALYFGFEGGGTFFGSDYSDFNYGAARLDISLKTYLSPTSILKALSISEYKEYRYSLFDSASQVLALSLDKYLESRTTLKAEVGWGYKYFLHPTATQEAEIIPENPSPGGKYGYGPGRRQQGGRGFYFDPALSGGGQGLQMASLSVVVAQGFGDRIGLRISGLKQWCLSGENPFVSVEEFYMIENPTYDSFSWKGYVLGGQLTVEIPWNVELKIGYNVSQKEYPGIESLGLDGTELGLTRQDTRKQFEVKVEKNFRTISLFLNYVHVQNASNDPLFDWKGYFVSGGLQWNLFFGPAK